MKKRYNILLVVDISCILILLYLVAKGSNDSTNEQAVQPLEMFDYIVPPADWTKYMIEDDFYISVSPTVELRKSDDIYTQEIKDIEWYGYKLNTSTPVFQQKELAVMDSTAFQTYCRIILDVKRGNPGNFI